MWNGTITDTALHAPAMSNYTRREASVARVLSFAIDEFGLKAGDTLLDPSCGTGEMLRQAMLCGLNVVGVEANPYLRLAARVNTCASYSLPELKAESARLLTEAKLFTLSTEHGDLRLEEKLPSLPHLERWIARRVALKVVAIRECIEEYVSPANREPAMLALASIIQNISSTKLSSHAFGAREVRRDAPVMRLFTLRLAQIINNAEWLQSQSDLGHASVTRQAPTHAASSITPYLPARVGIASPPFLGQIDSIMRTRLELCFLGYASSMEELAHLSGQARATSSRQRRITGEIRSLHLVESALEAKAGKLSWGWGHAQSVRAYFTRLLALLESMNSSLEAQGCLMLMVEDTAYADTVIPVMKIAEELANIAGYSRVEARVVAGKSMLLITA